MKATAHLTAEFDPVTGRTVLRRLRSMAPLTLLPKRGAGDVALVHLVNSATAPLGGDELALHVRVGPGARLRLSGVAATLALPGQRGGAGTMAVHAEVAEGGRLDYLPEPTVVTARARHHALLTAELAADARLRTREVLVLGRDGERPGELTTAMHVTRGEVPVLRQELTIGDALLDGSSAYLAGRRVLGTEVVVAGSDGAVEPVSGQWWSLTPLPAGGALATVLAEDAVTAERELAEAVSHHPAPIG
ncbi:urease accessory protein UreD [Prauserella halophila]|uniref:Urease accessory protein UreD n=1 Tax=Prauserella halophila TaxID=185641 RepID=A0ABN1W631_9PSEU|nr:urease accessory protein UreD [Prauserella halophila]MCP2235691.1 urease accessory protein [Prauserella halophila]